MRRRQSSSDDQSTKLAMKFLLELSASVCGQIVCLWLAFWLLINPDNEDGIDDNALIGGLMLACLPMFWILGVFPFMLLLTSIKYIILKMSRCNAYVAVFGAVMTMICIELLLQVGFHYTDDSNILKDAKSSVQANSNDLNQDSLRDFYTLLMVLFVTISCLFELCGRFLQRSKRRKALKFCLFLCTFVMVSLTVTSVIYLFP